MTSFFPTEQRQFKLDLAIEGTKGIAEILESGSKKRWRLHGEWNRRVQEIGWRSLIEGGNESGMYKLVLNSVWKEGSKVDFENQELKGAFSLIKTGWKLEGKGKLGVKVKIEKVKVDDKNKVWLIAAKGKENVYLMPVVRSSGKCELFDKSLREIEVKEAKSEIETQGAKNIGVWTKKFDGREEWLEGKNDELQKAMSNGFSITKKIDAAIYSTKTSEGTLFFGTKEEVEEKGIKGETRIRYIGRNAGKLDLIDMNEKTKNCQEIEHYFPLDLVVIGKVSVEGNLEKAERVTIADTISQVIGVCY